MGNEAENFSNSTHTGPNTESAATSTSTTNYSAVFMSALNKAKKLIFSPLLGWTSAKEENTSVKEIYRSFVIPLAAIPPVCSFLGLWLVGVNVPVLGTWRAPFLNTLVAQVIFYAMSLLSVAIGAFIVQKLAPKFEGSVDGVNSYKLVAYSAAPMYLAGIFSLIPALGILSLVGGLFGLYLFYRGSEFMTTVPNWRRFGFVALAILGMIVANLILFAIVGMVMPTPSLDGLNLHSLP